MTGEAGGLAHAGFRHGLGEGGGQNGLKANTALRKQLQVLFELRVQLGEGGENGWGLRSKDLVSSLDKRVQLRIGLLGRLTHGSG